MKIKDIIYAGAAMIFAACSNSDSLDTAAQQVPLTINASIDGEATRASSFGEGAQIGVFAGGEKNVLFSTADGVNFTSETPIYFSNEEMEVEAYAPYNYPSEFDSEDEYNFDKYGYLRYAKGTALAATGKVNLVFHHLMTQITMNVTLGEGYEQNDVSSLIYLMKFRLNGLKTKGTFTAPNIVTATGDATTIVPYCSIDEETDITKYTSCVIPQEVTSFEITAIFYYNDYTATVPVKGGKLDAGKNYIYNVKIDKEKMTVDPNSTISAWEAEESDDYVDVTYSGE